MAKTFERIESRLEDELIQVAGSLVVKGKELGSLLADEILEAFPEMEAEPDQVFRVFQVFEDMGIEVTDGDKAFEPVEPIEDTVLIDIEMADSVPFDDPIRLYLQEIGRVSLLTAAMEVVLAKAIEAGGAREALSLLTVPQKDAFGHLRLIDRTFPYETQNLARATASERLHPRARARLQRAGRRPHPARLRCTYAQPPGGALHGPGQLRRLQGQLRGGPRHPGVGGGSSARGGRRARH